MKQKRLTDKQEDSGTTPPVTPVIPDAVSTRFIELDPADFKGNPLWKILVETARRNPLYPGLTSYIRDEVLPKEPSISPRELASRLSISVGEALVLLDDLSCQFKT